MRYTVGLATTFHDPAIAIVGPDGEVLFAEASERYLQFGKFRLPDVNGQQRDAVYVCQEYLALIKAAFELVETMPWR
jgi:predicted NodU family carbamoyl transferase